MYKTDCFAWHPSGCRVFECEDKWNCDNCSSYKTWEQCYEEQKKCEKRLKEMCKKFRFEYSIPADILKELRLKDNGRKI